MKKFLLLLTALAGGATAQAEDYAFLTFETTDGERVSVPLESLTLSINGTTLTAGSETFTIENLSKMYFSSTDEATAVKEISKADLDEATDIYDLQGHKVQKEQMRRGAYIVKTKQGTCKIVVK